PLAKQESEPLNSQPAKRILNMVSVLQARKATSQQTALAMGNRAKGLEDGLIARTEQRASMQARYERFYRLIETGALQAQAEELDLRQRFLDRQGQIAEAIPRLRMQKLRLDAVLNNAELRAPSSGTISRLFYDTDQMFVPRGETVLTLTRPVQNHRVSFVVPAHAIDQTRVGMTGQLTFSSLPQRNHPKVRVTILSLSPEAKRNAEGIVLGYDGVADINQDDMALLVKQMGEDLSLFIDMPVTLVFVGRETTFSDYLIGPFTDFLSKALQD
ncbi:MAG: HlyD family efflux transporter periplasmic adaptor subunit, partial [Shimia sp.]|uniref:HlyD family efflux transporter periplasmic adaptor subunit n=1 Tax=Shimia sp. TaxID=1954381 RepID=UPI004058B0E0